ncbi:VIT1/CCC1 transporter family protein [Methanonatronarchaeum sp. AMET6-2]|uniref:VIT1/CCC1 transporter family protein n=1 Tax=Methanonatronarchaeum sp. AMET6-2 TaxID=2933293 RepID=UPI001223866C|nr:VIT1/CCC1 transporter family protein [Methanonatronarchaeum sp. AMET6-2]RZN62753.1 MAG: TIGR00267 family protein [Methanonatronarchaeia archaeon]UOY10349.1 VIT1/CCC1 transporter family protein [Methanonatronarchaeum sp. AMET6-2]
MTENILEIIESTLGNITRGAIDGILTTLGIVIGAYGAEATIIIAAGISGGVASGLSNTFAALSAERTEMEVGMKEIRKSMLREEMEDTLLHKTKKREVRIKALMDGAASVLGAAVPVTPYFFFPAEQAVFVAIGLTAIFAFGIGYLSGKVSGKHLFRMGIKMALIALVVAVIATLIQQGIHISLR